VATELPDLNPTDYKIWGIIQQQRLNRTKVQDVNDLMQHLIDVWARALQGSVASFMVRLLLSLLVKEFRKSINTWQSYGQE